jgi:hypothetical protein
MRGRITFSGDHYFVDRNGLQVGVRTTDVEVVAASLEEAYAKKKKAIDPTDFDRRLALAEWCMRQDLFGQCALELADCGELHENHPRVAELKRRLELILSAEKLAAADRDSHAASPVAARDDDANADRSRAGDARAGKSRAHENGGFGAISADASESFVKSIQPLLINQCAAGGCHGGNAKSAFSLTRFDARKTPSRAYTQRNLTAVLKYVDASAPGKSPLLTLPQQGHGTASEPIFQGKELGQYQALANWVYQAAGNDRAAPAVEEPVQAAQSLDRNKRAATASYDEPAATGRDAAHANHPIHGGRHAASENKLAENNHAENKRGGSGAARQGALPHVQSRGMATAHGRKPAEKGHADDEIPPADRANIPAAGDTRSGTSRAPNDAPPPADPADFNRRYFPDEPPKESGESDEPSASER